MGSSEVNYPWPSTVNVANFVTVKPCLKEEERSKFDIWKEQMLCLLGSQGLLGFIDGEIQPPEKDKATTVPAEGMSLNVESEQKQWRRTDRLVKGWILGSIGDDVLGAVWKSETARDVWVELDKIFNHKAADSELQPESDANAQKEDGGSGDFSRYLPLHKAALIGDWKTAKKFFDEHEEAAKDIITSSSKTALHLAVCRGKTDDFVKKLVDLMPLDALAIKLSTDGSTALHYAAMVGNVQAAKFLVNKNPNLLYILDANNYLPAAIAAMCCQKETLAYLMSMSKPKVEQHPFEGEPGYLQLVSAIYAQFLDVALDLAKMHPNLAVLECRGYSPLSSLATMNSVFPSGQSFSWWQKLIYRCIRVKQSKWDAARATSVAGDIENISRDAPAYMAQKLESVTWIVIEHLVPHVKGIRKKKEIHLQALELVRCLCEQMVRLPENEATTMFRDSIMVATHNGINEIVEVIIDMYPEASLFVDGFGSSVYLLAASKRFENVFNLIYNMHECKVSCLNHADSQGNNLMHVCAKLAPPDRLNLVPGAALQMQRELQWFKEMEKFVHPARHARENNDNQSPKVLFTKEHQQLKAEGEKWMKDTANACSITAALTATVVFAAAFTLPGGIATDTGTPIFSNQLAFILFAIADAISFFTSITSLLMFLSILTSRYAEEDFLYVLPKRLAIGLLSLFLSITFMMVAFSATLYLVFQGEVVWILIAVGAFACLPVASFVLLQFPLLVDVVYSTYGPGIFGKKRDLLLY